MFNNSENIQINGGTFASVSQNVNAEFPAIRDGLDILHRHTAPGATYDSGERLDPPTCDPDTRIAIIEEIMAWILSDARSSSMLWLRGSAGVGKSALAQSIAQRCHKKKRLAASFFFLRTSPKRSDGRLLITTIVFQLVSSFPATRSLVKKYVANNPSIFEKSLETQMQELFINPLNRVARNPFRRFFNRSQPRLIVIDGLDECSDPIVQCELIRVISHAVKSVKFPFRFLIASRPESHIIVTFNSEALRKTKIIRTNLSDDPNAGGDIKLFLRKRFRDIKETHPLSSLIPDDWPTAPMLQTLAQKSSGQFIYASTVIKYVQSRKHRPFGRLDIVLGLSPPPSNDTPFAELDALYTHILSGIEDIKSLLQILAVLIIPRHKDDSFGEYSTPAMLQKLLFLRPGDVELLLGDLLSLLSFTTPNEVIRILHASLADFLLDRTRARVFYIDLRMSHAALARGYIKYVSIEKHAPDAYRNPVIAHLRKAHMTPELRRDLAEFDFTSVFLKYNQATTKKVVYYIPAMDSVIDNTSDDAPTRFPPDSNPEYPWFWTTTFLASLKETGCRRSSQVLHSKA
ncbi:hypothetical protein B0H34DRAFT_297934 [Crassisporium funariophilum]|nr:hypothetical protein B0H34DRAFT_297934 [Crassisporium funariophilum]